ncbi:MAG: M48 family metalloprotease [Cyanobacteria bacterium P01_D01_bin.44]
MNQFKTLALLSLLSALLISISYYIIGGSAGVVMGIVLAAVTNLGSWYASDKIALAAYKAQPVTQEQAPQLYTAVANLAKKADIPMPGVYIIPTQSANAFATGRDPEHAAVAVTQGIMQMLSAEELEGVLAHELSHIMNRDTLTQAVAATIAGAIAFLAQMLQYSLWFGGGRDDDNAPNPLALMLTLFLAPMAATVIQMGISRTREFSADAGAAKLTGNPRALASALERLESTAKQMPMDASPAFSPLLIVNAVSNKQMFRSLFSTHPSTDDRIERLLAMEQEMLSASSKVSLRL